VDDIFAENCTLKWKAPADDGGAEVTGTEYKHLPIIYKSFM
jgi:hypothetical protein